MKISGSTPVTNVPKANPAGARTETAAQEKQASSLEKTIPGNDVRSAVENASDVDMSEVSRIRQAISDGSLSMDSQTLARAVMDMHLE